MKYSSTIVLSCVALGLALPALGGDGVGIRYIEHADPLNTALAGMSDDGSTLVFNAWGMVPSLLVDRGVGLQTIYESTSSSTFVWSGGVSDDGGLVSVNAFNQAGAMNWRPGALSGIPRYVHNGTTSYYTHTGAVSGDGLVNGMQAGGPDGPRVLLYQDRAFTDLGFEDGDLSFSLNVSGLDRTGSVMTLNQSVGNADATISGSHAWLWEEGGFTKIPDLVLAGDRVDSRVAGVSSDGSTAFGRSHGVFFDGEGGFYDWGPTGSWIYRDGIQTEILDDGFEYINATDITDDGNMLLVNAGSEEGGFGSYLWTSQDGFVSIQDILAQEGITISGDSVYFSAMSGDGTVLAGDTYTEGIGFTSFVVTIPSPGALLMLGGGLLMLSGRRR